MSLFPRSFTQELSPLFRMMDDYASLTRDYPSAGPLKSLRSFQPKFDVTETKEAYELHGELPGIEQKNINIEWTDGNTLNVSGRTETYRESANAEQQQGQVTGELSPESHSSYEKASVEDVEAGPSSTEEAAPSSSTAVATKPASQEVSKDQAQPKYWVSERSVGEFQRSFSFPARVDQDGVKASLKNGILSVVVPKAAKPAARKIAIE